mmetsp:Transcript_58575/g.104484  ORF Transcript_58575/g.104484 Transcript_58575/m.104484 type:complete len:247 (-) Transcript_58575:964-1704(-)
MAGRKWSPYSRAADSVTPSNSISDSTDVGRARVIRWRVGSSKIICGAVEPPRVSAICRRNSFSWSYRARPLGPPTSRWCSASRLSFCSRACSASSCCTSVGTGSTTRFLPLSTASASLPRAVATYVFPSDICCCTSLRNREPWRRALPSAFHHTLDLSPPLPNNCRCVNCCTAADFEPFRMSIGLFSPMRPPVALTTPSNSMASSVKSLVLALEVQLSHAPQCAGLSSPKYASRYCRRQDPIGSPL